MYYTQLPKEETGYVIFDVWKNLSFKFISPRLFICKINIDRVATLSYRHGRKISAYNVPVNAPNKTKMVSIQPNHLIELETFIGARFVEQCYFEVGILTENHIIESINTIIYNDTEQIKGIGKCLCPSVINDKDFYVYIKIPFPCQFELFPAYRKHEK